MKRVLCILTAVCLCLLLLPCRAGAEDACRKSRFSATFLQNWLCRDWTEERWIQEFSEAKAAGFDALILQSAFDIVRGDCTENGDPQDAASYPGAERFCMFPSEQYADYHSSRNSGDALVLALEAARQTDMQLWLGTVNDDMWWKFGWGVPKGQYFADWSASNAALCAALIAEMWDRYGAEYGSQIAGWYYVNEIWNMDAACNGTDGGAYAQLIGSNLRATVQAVEQSCSDKPILISPFYNPDLSAASDYTAFLSELFRNADVRSHDIFAGQDGGGKEYAPSVIREWTQAQRLAVAGNMQFWVNHECFNADFTAKPIPQLRTCYEATADLAGGHILFSWDHYYAQDPALNAQFTAYAFEPRPGDANGDGVLDTADVVALQKWLLAVPGASLADPDAADLDVNAVLDVFDLSLLKRWLLQA
ncbi:MAG: DUF4434 domain-containing protein [Oscillospiraceae bacterium]|nr:DUF4434 domain-containing protein [Oscillospiraceae bacterium]